MTLEGANIFFDATDYTIYTMNSANTGQYCVVLPKNNNGTYNMLVDLHMKNAFDGISNGSKTKEQLVEEIKNEYAGVKTKYSDGILVIPMIDENLYASAVLNNDKQKMFDKVKKVGAITSEIYKKLTDSGIDKQKIDQKIIIIIKNNDDIKFVDWLKEQMPNFVIGVNINELQVTTNTNPFMENSNPFMSETPSTEPVVPNDIFGVAPSQATEETNNNNIDNNIFNTPSATPEVVQPVTQEPTPAVAPQPVVEPTTPTQPVAPEPVATSVSTEAVATQPQAEPIATAPTEVTATPLEGTTSINPVTDTTNVTSEQSSEAVVTKKGSKGFVNLIILLGVLVGVTLISIELGKFLYNTYGV